jgi:hypothetical protein
MKHPDASVACSIAQSGELANKPETVISIVVTDREDYPCGMLEKWNGSAWIYASADALMSVEPAAE